MRADLIRGRLAAALLCAAAGLMTTGPIQAQTASPDDLRALVFYLQQGDQAAVQAELRRLRTQFPDWRPPSDLNSLIEPQRAGAAGPDVAGVWQRIERGDFAGARQLIDQNRRNNAGWSPDPEMLRVLELSEAQAAFDRAVAARNAPDAIAVARRAPQLMRCDRINNAWQLADMYQLAGQNGSAVATYRSTLASCTRYSDMEPTLEKADAIATPGQMSELFDTARAAAPASQPRLDTLEARLRAGRGGAVATATAPPAAPNPAGSASVVASAPRAPAAPANTPAFVTPPVTAAPVEVSAQADLARLPLRGDSRVTEVRATKEAEAWGRCLAQSRNPRSLDLLYERSWCALGHDRPGEALAGFAAVVPRAEALGGNVPRDSRYGLALAHLSLHMTEEGARIAGTAHLDDSQRREVERIILDQRGVRAYQLGQYRQAIAFFDALEQLGGALRRDLAILRAYAHLNSGQRSIARAQFETLHAQLATAETRAGLNAAR